MENNHQMHEMHHNQHSGMTMDHGGHNDHSEHNGHNKHAGHSILIFRNRFYASLVLTIPVLVLSPIIQQFF